MWGSGVARLDSSEKIVERQRTKKKKARIQFINEKKKVMRLSAGFVSSLERSQEFNRNSVAFCVAHAGSQGDNEL